MTEQRSLESLQGLHQDLIALGESRLRNINKLWVDLEARVDEFRKLLDKSPKNESSRRTLHTGTIRINDEEYSVNDEFKEGSLQVADALDLDETDSARLLLEALEDTESLGRSHIASAIIQFHVYRQFLLECLRLLLKQSSDPDLEEDIRDVLRQIVTLILENKDGPARNASLFAQKCFRGMAEIEQWHHALGERYLGTLALGQTSTPQFDEIMGFQRLSLGQQHESLGAILTCLAKANCTVVEDFYKLLEHMRRIERWNNLVVHYIPVIAAFTSQYGSPDGSGSLREARLIHSNIMDSKDTTPWALRNLQAATTSWWLAEYSGWYHEKPVGSPVQGVDLDAEALARSEAFFKALKDGAFQCVLSLCSQVKPDQWYDPAKQGLIQFLLGDALVLPLHEAAFISPYFRDLIMEQFETFADAFITNMPDTLRKFRIEEDNKRKMIDSGVPIDLPGSTSEQDLHLERFLVIIAFAFDNRMDAAQLFWADADSNLYGFLQWASKRQSTPRVGAFCEMLRSISKGEDCATSAHRFLLEEGDTTSSRIRRSSSLSWAQIFGELSIYTPRVREHPVTSRPTTQYVGRPSADEINEPESALMLECYLRLMSHLCYESAVARSWVLSHPTFRVLEVLFHLCSSTIPSRIQSRVFATIRSLLTNKTVDIGMSVWSLLDQWASGGFAPSPNLARPTKITNASTWAEEVTFDAIAKDFEESSEFISLLQSLVSPIVEDVGLNDALPFPEHLGSAYRMPGIEPYIDLVLGKIFASKIQLLAEPLQSRILSSNILNFVATCLATFNEDLVILANRSTLPVDAAMNTSSLLAYVRLHPFCRVMEWMFNERVLAALFASAHQDISEVSNASPDSPVMLSLLRSIDVMNLIMDMQSTYLDIIRPLIKLQSNGRKETVSTSSLACFEDSVELNLIVVVDLGLYCGVGVQELAVSSLKLLEKFASSRKLNVQSAPGLGQRLNGNRLIGVLEQQGELEPIARSLTLAMHFDTREISQAGSSSRWIIKSVILDFLNHCLALSSGRPTLAHALLGFYCTGTSLDVEADSLFANSSSLFHAILHMVVEYPYGDEDSFELWSLSLKQKGMQLLSTLWASPLTSIFTLTELRTSDFLFALFLRQRSIDPSTEWNGRLIREPEFMYTDAGLALEQYLKQRCALLECTSLEIRLVAAEGAPSLKARIFSTLLGTTSIPDGRQLPNLTIFDLLDFVEVELATTIQPPKTKFFAGVDFTISTGLDVNDTAGAWDPRLVEEITALRLNELRKSGHLSEINEEQAAFAEAQSLVLHFYSENNRRLLAHARSHTLKAWVNLLTLTVGHCDLDQGNKSILILQALQVLTPKLERYAVENVIEAIELAQLVQALFLQLEFTAPTLGRTKGDDVANDRLYQVFRTALRAIHIPDGDVRLREVLYNICYQYLAGMSEASKAPHHKRHSTQTVKTAGEKVIDIICDDAYGGSGTGRISALLLLDALAALAKVEKSSYIFESLVRTNFIYILVDTIKDIPQELLDTSAQDVPLLLSYYDGKLSLLLTISNTRSGAINVMNAGLFEAVRASGLFSVDPDLGLEFDNPEALSKYYKLLASVLRVIASVVLSRGPQNQQTIEQARLFMRENRASMVGIFKRQARIGATMTGDATRVVDELVELFVLLISMTDFLEYEENRETDKPRKLGFA